MKYLHIFPPYIGKPHEMIDFLKAHFSTEDHKFLIMANKNESMRINPLLLTHPEILYLPIVGKKQYSRLARISYIKRLLDEAQYIIWHSYYLSFGTLFLLLCSCRKYLKKSIWIENGQDLRFQKMMDFGFKRKIKNKLLWRIRSEVKYIGLTLHSDEEKARELYGDNKIFFDLPKPFNAIHKRKLFRSLSDEELIEKKKKLILLGYDGQPYNCHMNLLGFFPAFADDEFRLICPMNWAMLWEWGIPVSPAYRQKVRAEASYLCLKDKVSILNCGGLRESRYFSLLKRIDIAVFLGERPEEIDLLIYLLYLQKKVFLPADQPLYKMLTEFGFVLFDANSIPDLDFDSFCEHPSLSYNTEIALQWMDDKRIEEKWYDLFLKLS